MVDSGLLHIELGHESALETVRMSSRHVLHVSAATIHRLIGITDVDVIEVSTTELDDAVRMVDDYGREGSSAGCCRRRPWTRSLP